MFNVHKFGEYYYVQLGERNEGGKYYFEMYLERWAAETTVIGLKDCWNQQHSDKDDDIKHLFVYGRHAVRLCQINREYVAEFGLDPREIKDTDMKAKGWKYRIKSPQSFQTYVKSLNGITIGPQSEVIEL